MSNCLPSKPLEKGSIYIWMLFTVTIAGILLAETGQIWQFKTQREKEKELLLVGEQFRQAVMSYYNSDIGGEKKYPKSLEDLILDRRGAKPERHLRKIFIDPMTKDIEWGLVEEPMPDQENSSVSISRSDLGIIGVFSLSEQAPIKIENFPEHYSNFAEANTYQDWQFVFTQESADAEGGSAQGNNQTQPTGSQASSPFSSPGQTPPKDSGSGSGFPSQGQTNQNQSGGSLFQ